jgi:hypothetical protein
MSLLDRVSALQAQSLEKACYQMLMIRLMIDVTAKQSTTAIPGIKIPQYF